MGADLVFGPINSKRFGISLGIDLSPTKKMCNFDCLYCELTKSKPVNFNDNDIKPIEYIKAIKKSLEKEEVDILTITANGEPTLYKYLEELISLIKKEFNQKLLILTNGSLLYKKDIQNSLKDIDIVKISLDCLSKECFKKLDRVDKDIDIDKMLLGIKEFVKDFKNEIVFEILVVKDLNDNIDEIGKIALFLKDIKPHRIDLSTIDRPPAYGVKGVDFKTLLKLKEILKDFNVTIPTKFAKKQNIFYSNEEILKTLSLRSLNDDDIDILFCDDSKKRFCTLVKDGKIVSKMVAGVRFYTNS